MPHSLEQFLDRLLGSGKLDGNHQILPPRHGQDPTINTASEIDEIVFRRSEYLGGMAAVLLALIARDD